VQRHQVLTTVRAASVALVIVAIVVQAAELIAADRFDPTRFFAYFTIQSNLVGVVAFAWLLARGRGERGLGLELFRGAAAVYLTVTFGVVIALLSDVDVSLQLAWVDFVLHKLFPIVVVLDWALDPPKVRLTIRHALVWIVYPLIWTALTIVRGALDGWYPYPFLDPANGGYGQVAITVVAVTIGFLAISAVVVVDGNRRRDRLGARRDVGPDEA
jgi:hypothetical protein